MRSLDRVALLSWCLYVWDGRALWSYGTLLRGFSLRLDSPMFWAPWHYSISAYSQPSFSSATWKRGGVWMCKLGWYLKHGLRERLSYYWVNRKSYMPRRLAQRMTRPWVTISGRFTWSASRAISAVVELLVLLSHSCFLSSILCNCTMYEFITISINQSMHRCSVCRASHTGCYKKR